MDFCYSKIMEGEWEPDCRIPSVKELSVAMVVNNRTVLQAYDNMQADATIYQRRGLGYYVSPDARNIILEMRRKEFYDFTLPEVKQLMCALGLSFDDIKKFLE